MLFTIRFYLLMLANNTSQNVPIICGQKIYLELRVEFESFMLPRKENAL